MTIIDTGSYGAKRQSYRKAQPRDVLKRLLDENSHATEQEIQKLFDDATRDDHEMADAMREYWFANNYRSLVQKEKETPNRRADAVKAKTAAVESIKSKIKANMVRMVLLDVILPSGKALRHSTGKDCAKAGGWLAKIAKTIKPNDVVGKVLSETQVRKLFGAA